MKKELESKIMNTVSDMLPELLEIKKYLYENPEVGGTEKKASIKLADFLSKKGFEVTKDFCDIDYAFKAVYDSNKPGPAIGVCAEYDALPEIGHGCGHNLIAAVGIGAACALKSVVDETGGKVVLFGTPAEENLVRKADMARAGAFDEVDVCLMAHPEDINISSCHTRALEAMQVEFYGRSSHAGGAPELGINALDAAVEFYQTIKANTPDDINIHGVITSGGVKPSIIPDYAEIKYFCRADKMKQLEDIEVLFHNTAKAVCDKIGTTYKIWNYEPSNKDMIVNQTLSDVFDEMYEYVGGGKMNPSEGSGGSTDMGDVSYVCPAIHPYIGIGKGVINHSVGFAEATMTDEGNKAMECGAKAIAMVGLRVLTEPELLKKIKTEFENNSETIKTASK